MGVVRIISPLWSTDSFSVKAAVFNGDWGEGFSVNGSSEIDSCTYFSFYWA